MIHDPYLWKKEGLPQPHNCTIDLTEGCNLACSYCFTYSEHRPRKLDKELGKRLIEWMLCQASPGLQDRSDAITISFWGGEPLLEWKMLKELVAFANDIAGKYGIPNERLVFGGTTNGVLYTPDKVQWCKDHKCLMLISYDGIQPAHDLCRKFPNGKGSWEIVDRNLRLAMEVAPNTHTRMSFSPQTMPYLLESIQYLHEEIGVQRIAFSPVYEADWDDETIQRAEAILMDTVEYAIKQAKQGTPVNLKHLNDEVAIGNSQTPQNPCGAGGSYIGFSVDGFGFPCHRFNKHGLTSEERAKLPHVISMPDGDTFRYCNKEFRKEFFEFKDNPPSKCLGCETFLSASCKGGCYAVNFDLTGSVRIPSYQLCAFNTMQHRVGQYYAERAEKEGIIVPHSGWDGGGQRVNPKLNQTGCICYNMCYQEGTEEETILIDSRHDRACLCDQTNYSETRKIQYRPIWEIKKQTAMLKKHLHLCRRILATGDIEKTGEMKQLESKVIDQTLDLLEREL